MNNISMKQNITAAAALSAVAVFGMLSFGNSTQAATQSHNCAFLSGVFGLRCCDGISGSQVFNVSSTCHEPKKIIYKRKPPRPNYPILIEKEWHEARGNDKDKGQNEHK